METATKTLIKPEELRIGNWILVPATENGIEFQLSPLKVLGVGPKGVLVGSYASIKTVNGQMYHLADGNCEYEEKEMYASITKVEPIPLTPEILEKAGFKKRPNGVYQKGSFVLQEAVGFGYWVIAQVDQVDGTVHLLQNELRYVHKMQNIFYDLGEELKIEL